MARTTYHVLVRTEFVQGEMASMEYWRYLGQIESSSADAARIAMLKEEDIAGGHAIAVPERSWNPEWFGLEKVEPRYVKGKKAPANQGTLEV